MISELTPNQYIVVGTNDLGLHAGGAAAQAHRDFGALLGCARGCIGGQTYGIATLDKSSNKVEMVDLRMQVFDLRTIAKANPDKEFLLTPVGTGIAGFKYKDIEGMFEYMPENVVKVGWYE